MDATNQYAISASGALVDATKANGLTAADNELLIKNAKSFGAIVLEKTGKTVDTFLPSVGEKIVPPVYLDEPIK